jgi:hypothetical protein
MPFAHGYPFDPSYGYGLGGLLAVEAPPEPADFAAAPSVSPRCGGWTWCWSSATKTPFSTIIAI